MIWLALIPIGIVLIQLFICLWNDYNLDLRRYHRQEAEYCIKNRLHTLAYYHIGKAERAQKWYIRIGGSK